MFIKVAGGLRLDEPAADLGICMALISSLEEILLPASHIYIGEVGLGGEIRGANRIDERINEALKLGFSKIYIPKRITISRGFPSDIIVRINNLNAVIH